VRRRGRWRDRLVDLYRYCILPTLDGRYKPSPDVDPWIPASIYRSMLPSALQDCVATKATSVLDLCLVLTELNGCRIEIVSWQKITSCPSSWFAVNIENNAALCQYIAKEL